MFGAFVFSGMVTGNGMPMATPIPVQEREDMEMFIDPFQAWRAWSVHVDTEKSKIRLQSITYKLYWPPEVPFRARCMRRSLSPSPTLPEKHEGCPDVNHGCGIHGLKDREDAMLWMNYGGQQQLRCIGEIKMWGLVFRFTKGYLSEYAYPSKIWVEHEMPENFPIDSREVVHELRRTYRGVEVRML